ncbi:MAG: phenylalanine 4-monooxygenase [Pseudomonadota bacterium]
MTPVTYGQGQRPPRGNYTQARADYTCEQAWDRITSEEHALYRRLHHRQTQQLPGKACDEFIQALSRLGDAHQIPRFDALSDKLFHATKWEVVAVPGLIPEEAFFALLSQRKFPVTNWLRLPEEFDYVVEPDVFHDLFGHVPLLFNPWFADYMQAYGLGGLKASRLEACEFLARLYWYTVEFGLIQTPAGLRAYGAGLLSSAGELPYSLNDVTAHRFPFDLERIMRTKYTIDSFQKTYFVIDSFQALFDATAPDFASVYDRLRPLPALPDDTGD